MPFRAYDAATHSIGRARALLDTAQPKGRLPVPVRADLRRLSIVMGIAALDTYMHRLVIERAYSHDKLPGALARLEVTFEELLETADGARTAARAAPHRSRPRVAVKRQLRDRLLRETFQAYDDVSKALGMAGRPGNWEAIGQHFSPPMTPKEIKLRLNRIVVRRNQIVHEGDYKRLERPRTSARNGLSHSDASSDVAFLANLVDAIHSAL